MSVSTIKDQDGKEYIIFDESELYDDKEMGNKLEDFEILQILGKGSYGFVAKVRSIKNDKIYAMKQIDLNKIGSEKEIELCKREVVVLQKLNHPNINKYHTSFTTNNNCLYIIMEFMNNGDLAGFIKAHEKFNKPVREEEVWNILLQSMTALEYIHSKNVIHRDIKPANLFMTNDKTIKIGDFGVAAKIAGIQTSVRGGGFTGTIVGTPLFMSPEILREEQYDKKTDVYSMGITMYELCFFQSPRKAGINPNGSVVFANIPLTRNQGLYSQQLLMILQYMIEEDQTKRPSSSELCQMIRTQYIQTFLKTSALSSVTRCLYSHSRLIKNLMKIQMNNNKPMQITQGFIQAIQQIQNNINDKFNQFKEILAIQNPKLNSDDEIDPEFIVAYLLEKMHKELNVINYNQSNLKEPQYLINTTFNGQDEEKSNKNVMLERFFKHFAKNFNSPISNIFFGILKDKKICKQCGVFNYSYGCFCLLTFDLNELCGFNNNGVHLNNLFQAMHERKKEYGLQDKIYCDRCLSYQIHIKSKQIYSMPIELIIALERGVNCMNKTLVNFPFDLDISNYVEYQSSPKRYQLVGCVNRADINGKEHYISFSRINNTDNWIFSDDDKISQADKNMANTYGIPVLLFYSFVRGS